MVSPPPNLKKQQKNSKIILKPNTEQPTNGRTVCH